MAGESKIVPRPAKAVSAALAPEQEKLARKLLIDGATFEDVVLTLAAQGHRVPQHVVENYFRSDPELPALRAQHAVEVARKIRHQSEGGDPQDVQFADAVIMTGLLRLNRSTALLDVNDALRRRYEHENLALKQRVLRLRERETQAKAELYRAHKRMLSIKWETARHKLRKMKQELKRSKKTELTGPQLAARIEEIYGLVEAPPVPPVGAPKTEE
jgi:hypothetical protein